MSIAVNKKRRWQHNYRRWVIDWDNAPPWMNQPWKVIHIRNEVFPECFDYFRAREGSCHTPSTNGSSGCSGDFWQRITTLNSEQITPPAGSKRIVAGLCTWQCHVNVIHELKKKKSVKCLFCQSTTRRLLIFKSLGMCNTHVMDFLSAIEAGLCI